MTLFALHGFLGNPTDWEKILTTQINSSELNSIFCNLYDASFSPPEQGLVSWGDRFNAFAEKTANTPRYLIGYSLGGRLGLHALTQSPSLWHAAIFVSTHPGLPLKDRSIRAEQEAKWAQAFQSEPFPNLLKMWNAQPLFGNTPFPSPRLFHDLDRPLLVSSLQHWSLSCQDLLQTALAKIPLPILWVVGQRDAQCYRAASQLSFSHPSSKICIFEDAHHRIPWEQPTQFIKTIFDFIESMR